VLFPLFLTVLSGIAALRWSQVVDPGMPTINLIAKCSRLERLSLRDSDITGSFFSLSLSGRARKPWSARPGLDSSTMDESMVHAAARVVDVDVGQPYHHRWALPHRVTTTAWSMKTRQMRMWTRAIGSARGRLTKGRRR